VGLTAKQLAGHRARARAELERDYQAKAKAQIKLLKQRVRNAAGERRAKLKRARSICRGAKRAARAKGKDVRARHLEAARAEIGALHAVASGACSSAVARAQRRAAESARRAGAALDAESRYQATIRRAAAKPRLARADALKAARERSNESDDQVAGNIDRELVPVWRARAAKTKATERATRTEVFMQWVHDHPADVQRALVADIDRQVAAWVAEEKHHSKRSRASRAQLQDPVPF
jgi:hypothetical protein